MSTAKIFYFTLQDEQTKEEKLTWFARTRFEEIPFQHITPDKKANWINLTDNDFDSLLPLIDKDVKAGKSQEAVFQLFSAGIKTQRDEWVYDFSKEVLMERMKYFVEVYQERLEKGINRDLNTDIKWDRELEKYLIRKVKKDFEENKIVRSLYRPFVKMFFYFDRHFNGMPYQWYSIHPDCSESQIPQNLVIGFVSGSRLNFSAIATETIANLSVYSLDPIQCLPLYRYDKNGNRIDNITDWALEQFCNYYRSPSIPLEKGEEESELALKKGEEESKLAFLKREHESEPPFLKGGRGDQITKLDIFYYTYAVLHHPAYRSKYKINLKREFPRLPFYPNFYQWVVWGKTLMDLHLNFETIEPYGLERFDMASKTNPKTKLKADKTAGVITLDENTQLQGVPALAWEYKLGNRSALEWILDQYKEKTPKDPTIAKLFNTYKFADYKEYVIDLLQRVCTVSTQTMAIIQQMPPTAHL
ncbi:Putative helicase [Gloeomargarita lithophora Alchichica-D10]|uniref:Helicase n=1 Tax=Gloeomargarita lithophora Alchichica-D10 TaxID=1188229 RepID=A0A1J0ACB5_9CYAN|nr:type ISP restriction/modification enzyme [Gloeomargarita lithophora]APB33571.1 Putative helicase [Gloeomargarita lithophora Alchichica-D10]